MLFFKLTNFDGGQSYKDFFNWKNFFFKLSEPGVGVKNKGEGGRRLRFSATVLVAK